MAFLEKKMIVAPLEHRRKNLATDLMRVLEAQMLLPPTCGKAGRENNVLV